MFEFNFQLMKMIQPCALFKVYSGFVTDTTVETIQKKNKKRLSNQSLAVRVIVLIKNVLKPCKSTKLLSLNLLNDFFV